MTRNENRDALEKLAARLIQEFGIPSAAAIQRVLFEELGGMRITIPTMRELETEARNRRIRAEFHGDNHLELSLRWGLSVRHVRRIVNES